MAEESPTLDPGGSGRAVLSAFPLLAVSSSVIGGDIRTAIVARMGLNDQARRDVDALIATGNQAVATLTWFSASGQRSYGPPPASFWR